MSERTASWASVFSGDIIRGADGRPWRVERQTYDAAVVALTPVILSGEGSSPGFGAVVFGQPADSAEVVVIRTGEHGQAIALLRDVLGAEIMTREESK
jgi:hypothetical protein